MTQISEMLVAQEAAVPFVVHLVKSDFNVGTCANGVRCMGLQPQAVRKSCTATLLHMNLP
jgi:hypothetical protein